MPETPAWIKHRSISAAAPSPVSWLVDDYIPANTVTLLSSVSGSGKSVLALQLGICIAYGRDWLGLKCRQSRFAYWDQDNPDGWLTDNRICAIKRGLGLEGDITNDSDIFRSAGRVLGRPERIAELIHWMQDIEARVLFVDTLASVNPYSELDPNEMARAVVENFFPFVDAGITPIVLHHIGKDFVDNKGATRRRTGIHAPRGSTALVAAVGAAFNLDKSDDGSRKLECIKPRYGSAPTIHINYDEDGHVGSGDWRITVTSRSVKVSHDFLIQFIKEHKLRDISSRELVRMLATKGYSVSQSTASRALGAAR